MIIQFIIGVKLLEVFRNMQVQVKPQMLRWARKRAGLSIVDVSARFPDYPRWEDGQEALTFSQLQKFSSTLNIPIGYFFLDMPPKEEVDIQDFRTIDGKKITNLSVNLRDTIYLCQRRQDWYREYSILNGLDPIDFVGSARTTDNPKNVALIIKKYLKIDEESFYKTRVDPLKKLRENAESIGILVMINGVVGSNNKRALSVKEFRGFSLSDDRAPLIFINGKDSKTAQVFSFLHEVAHIFLGTRGVSNISFSGAKDISSVEKWCNAVAAEVLVPLEQVEIFYNKSESVENNIANLASYFKVSHLVIILRLKDAKLISKDDFARFWNSEQEKMAKFKEEAKSKGGNFYANLNVRVGTRFLRAIIGSTQEGGTLFRDAFSLIGIKNRKIFNELSDKVWGDNV